MSSGIPFRLAFVLPGGEDWVRKVVEELVPGVESLGGECVFLSEGPSAPHLGGTWIELDGLEANPGLRRLAAGYPHRKIEESVVEREFRYCRARFGEKFSRKEVRKRYGTWTRQARALFRLIQPDAVWVWNGTIYRAAAFATMAGEMKLPVRYAEKGVMPGSWALDPRGVNAASSLPELPEPGVHADRIAAMRSTIGRWDGAGDSAWEQPERGTGEALTRLRDQADGRKLLFFPGQVDSDSNIICFSPHVACSLEALGLLVENLGEEYFIVAKPHPKGQAGAQAYRASLGSRGLVMENIHVLDAISICDLVVSINSTVAFEAVIRSKPVFLLGKGVLSGRSFVAEWNPEKGIDAQVKEWVKRYRETEKEMTARALGWAAFLRDEYYLFLKDGARLTARLEQEVRESRPIRPQGDRLGLNEIAPLCGVPEVKDLTRMISGRTMLGISLKRLFDRFQNWFRVKKDG